MLSIKSERSRCSSRERLTYPFFKDPCEHCRNREKKDAASTLEWVRKAANEIKLLKLGAFLSSCNVKGISIFQVGGGGQETISGCI